jgi:hypothetical protein
MAERLVPCGACLRHIRCTEVACPFCGAVGSIGVQPAREPFRRMAAAAAVAAGVVALTGCSSSSSAATTTDGGADSTGDDLGDDGSAVVFYGAAGPIGDGSAAVFYGGPFPHQDAAAPFDASAEGKDGGDAGGDATSPDASDASGGD